MESFDFSGYHLLVVEDNPHNFTYIDSLLSKKSVVVYHALNGKEAIELCRDNPQLSMVIMDAMMPEMDGFDATREIKKFRPYLPVVMLTAFVSRTTIREAVAAGCNDYLSKPIGKIELLAMLEKWLLISDKDKQAKE